RTATRSGQKGGVAWPSGRRVVGAVDVHAQAVQRGRRGDVEVVALRAAEGEVGHHLRDVQLADERAVGGEAVQSVVSGRPQPSGVVDPESVERARVARGEHLAATELAAGTDVE